MTVVNGITDTKESLFVFLINPERGAPLERDMLFASRTRGMKRSVIRELLKLTSKPEVISFAGGLPAPQTFPVQAVRDAVVEVLDSSADLALQYGATEGNNCLRQELAKVMEADGIKADPSHILVTTASQQGLDLIAKVFLDPGDTCVCGLPTYLGGLQAFRSYEGIPVGTPLDDHGMIPEELEKTLNVLEAENRRPRFIYIIPDFQNPAGVTIPGERRKRIVEIARERDYLIVEDTPYRQIRFTGEHQPTFQSLAPERVLSLYTFSKIMLPGFRIGWAYGPDWIVDKMVMAKQSADLCTTPFCQAIAAKMLQAGVLEKGLQETIKLYRHRCNLMLKCFDEQLAGVSGVHWTRPEGGLFLWLTIPEGNDTTKLFEKAIERNVAYVPGSAFYPEGDNHLGMRLNFSFSDDEKTVEGVRRLSGLIIQEIGR